MEQTTRRTLHVVDHLYAMLDAGERGYAVAAANVNNRALKTLFKTHARQRADFKAELAGQIAGLGTGFRSLTGAMAMIHRGRMNIFAALTIGEANREQVVMKQVLVGEHAALMTYERALNDAFPAPIKEVVQNQYKAIQEVVEQVQLLRGTDGKQEVVRLYDSEADTSRALKALQEERFDPATVQRIPVVRETASYDSGRQNTLFETMLSGAAGGALWGSISGTLAGFGVLHLPGLGLAAAPLATQEFAWALVALSAIAAGAIVGATIGAFIGWGIQSGDVYLYNEGQRRGQVLLRLQTEPRKAQRAAQIMAQVNREARAGHRHALA